jgi:CRISPR/Cas system-associated exonuclease Cas4 (RecB family)
MVLPNTFQFNQSSLQDYVDCPRRFQLRYVLMQPWPGLITDSPAQHEQHMQRAADFHRLAHQHALGLDADHLAARIHDETLARWWRTYLEHQPPDLPHAIRRAEAVLAAPLAGYRIVAKLDLLAVEPGERLVVVDWKTVLKRPQRSVLARRLQTRVYRYLTVEAGAAFNNGHRPRPEQVEMVYWFAVSGGDTERFPYNTDQHAADRAYLAELISRIASNKDSPWPLTADERTCRFCNYRSLCDRGVRAGFLDELEEDTESGELDIILEQVAEIEF